MEKMLKLQMITPVAVALLIAVLLSDLSTNLVSASNTPRPFKKHHLHYYVQLDTRSPGISLKFIPPINTTLSANFGAGTLFALNVTKDVEPTSKRLGTVRGYTVETSYLGFPDSALLEVAMVEYDDGKYSGTLQLQGLASQQLTELAVQGGSGSFRGLHGYLVVTLVVDHLPTRTFRHDVTFL
ncbi:hypothetical protein KP509_20G026600 [Ceratopteris richardii]|uniref:Dirigent protein n=1 Tax=Ceratopteris richardii TaxID=49495 RepID=A0A8T2SDZ4_CERRI|nr:hypothetical protein KP509_20G026500 [Ceratopteris richardii]KAH7331321.1 hypothetical protein KP509_20G026600 [Ceratopteris richardii]